MKRKPIKITFTRWAMLQTGGISSINHGRARLSHRKKTFIMDGPKGEHVLSALHTNAERLNAHWRSFAKANYE